MSRHSNLNNLQDIAVTHDGYSEPTLFVVDPRSSTDLIDLWNLRQFTPLVLPINADWASEERDFIREFVTANHLPLPGNPHGIMIHTTVQFGRSFSEKRAMDLATALLDGLPSGSWGLKLWYERIWEADRTEDHVTRPRRVGISASSSDLELAISAEQRDRSIRFPSLAPDFASAHGEREARWVNVLRLRTYGSDEQAAVVLPRDFPKETLVRLRVGGDGAVVSREGLVLPQHFKRNREYLQMPSGTQAVIEWLGAHGIAAKVSGAGRIVDQVLNSIGGSWGASLLADRETLETLDAMAKSVRRDSDRSEEHPDRAKPVEFWKGLVARRNNRSNFFKNLTLDAFVNAKILRLGLEIECPSCTYRNWCGLGEIDEQVLCERCLKRFDFPQGSLNFRYTPWQYRVVGPFSVPKYAGGAYGTVLALRFFARSLQSGADTQLTFSTSLDIALDPVPGEVDFVLWYQRETFFEQDRDTQIVFGEAKSFAVESFQLRDIERMQKLATSVPGAFLVFATLKESLSETEKSEIGRLALWGRELLTSGQPRGPVIVLTAMEMFSE